MKCCATILILMAAALTIGAERKTRLNQGMQWEPNTIPERIVGWVCDPNAKPLYGILLQQDRRLHIHDANALSDGTVKLLCRSGRVCEAMGHNWRSGRPGESYDEEGGFGFAYADYHPYTTYRTCRTCGACQSQDLSWK